MRVYLDFSVLKHQNQGKTGQLFFTHYYITIQNLMRSIMSCFFIHTIDIENTKFPHILIFPEYYVPDIILFWYPTFNNYTIMKILFICCMFFKVLMHYTVFFLKTIAMSYSRPFFTSMNIYYLPDLVGISWIKFPHIPP